MRRTSSSLESWLRANPNFLALGDAMTATIAADNREDTCDALRAAIALALPEDTTRVIERCVKKLHLLLKMKGRMAPERLYTKLKEIIIEEMATHMPEQMRLSFFALVEEKMMPWGAFDVVFQQELSMSVDDVPTLLDAYHWKHNARREHAEHLLTASLRAVAEFRSSTEAVRALTSLVEVEGGFQRARARLNAAVSRALRKHVHEASKHMPIAIAQDLHSCVERLAAQQQDEVMNGLRARTAALEHVSLEEDLSSGEAGDPARAIARAEAPLREIPRSQPAAITEEEEPAVGFEMAKRKKSKRAQQARVVAEMAALRSRLAEVSLPAGIGGSLA